VTLLPNGRLACEVPFCTRTRGRRRGEPAIRRGEQWVCGEHWQPVSYEAKRRKRKWERHARRFEKRGDKLLAAFCWRKAELAWQACRREAIEVAAGITGKRRGVP